MPAVSKVVSVLTTDAAYTVDLTEPYLQLNLYNMHASQRIWVNYQTGGVSTVEGNDCILIPPGLTIVIQPVKVIKAISETGTSKLHIWGSNG